MNSNLNHTTPAVNKSQALGQALAKARRNSGLTQEELCKKTDIPYSTLTKIERGVIKQPNVFIILKIAQATNNKIEDFFSQINLKPPVFNTAHQNAGNKKTSKSGIEFVFFDIHQTLINSSHAMMGLIAAQYAIPPLILEELYLKYNQQLCKGQISLEVFDDILDQKFNTKGIDWQEYYLKVATPDNNVIQACNWVNQYYRIGILTNAFKGNCQALIKANRIPDIFEVIVDSSVTGLVKPDKDIYDYAQAKTKLQANQILLVDDRQINILAAQQNGWHGYKINTKNSINTLKDLQTLLKF